MPRQSETQLYFRAADCGFSGTTCTAGVETPGSVLSLPDCYVLSFSITYTGTPTGVLIRFYYLDVTDPTMPRIAPLLLTFGTPATPLLGTFGCMAAIAGADGTLASRMQMTIYPFGSDMTATMVALGQKLVKLTI